MAGFGEVEPGAYAGGCGCGRCDQDGDGDAAWCAAADAARGRPVLACGLVGGCGGAADRAGAVVAGGRSASGGCVLLRHQRHQRPRHPRTAGSRSHADRRRCRSRRTGCRRAVGALRPARGRAAGAGRATPGVHGRKRCAGQCGGPRVLAGHAALGVRSPCDGAGEGQVGCPGGARGGRPGRGRRGRTGRHGPYGLPVLRPGFAAAWYGPGVVRAFPGVRGGVRRGVCRSGRASGAAVA